MINRIEQNRSEHENRPTAEQLILWCHEHIPQGVSIVLPFSGGLDSATIAAALARSHAPQQIYGFHMSHDSQAQYESNRAKEVAANLGINFIPVDMHTLNHAFRTTFDTVRPHIGIGNGSLQITQNATLIQGFCREVARQMGGRLVGTLDLTERCTGYYPKECFSGDLLPIGGLWRTDIRRIAGELGLEDLPESFVEVPGCGNIVGFVNSQLRNFTGPLFETEAQLDFALEQMLIKEHNTDPLAQYCRTMRHKAAVTQGRPTFGSDYIVSAFERWINSKND